MKKNAAGLLGFVLSGFLVAWGQPARISFLGPFAAAVGFALFWTTLYQINQKKKRTVAAVATSWFGGVQWVQLSWMASTAFQGYYTLFLHLGLSLVLGMQFAVATYFLWLWNRDSEGRRIIGVLATAGLWVGLEWSRLWFLCGFSWNPVGLFLSSSLYSLQAADLFGVYGLSFWVFLVNGIVFIAMTRQKVSRKGKFSWEWIGASVVLALFPYCYGGIRLQQKAGSGEERFEVALVQTGLLPSQKVPMPGREADFVNPVEQWRRILEELVVLGEKDLIVLPEATVPWGAYDCRYSYQEVIATFKSVYGAAMVKKMPLWRAPEAKYRGGNWWVSNAFWAQALANLHNAELVIGMDYRDLKADCYYNSAFYFTPFNLGKRGRYDKKILLPIAEYLPFSWLKRAAARYGIFDFFSPGQAPGIFGEKWRFSLSVCYEETFPHLIRRDCTPEVDVLVNATNDGYYPFSRLPEQHFSHARLRAVENGRPLLRACNTGVTAAIDAAGRILSRLEKGECERGVLSVSLPRSFSSTGYSLWGDNAILVISAFCGGWGSCLLWKRRKTLKERRKEIYGRKNRLWIGTS